MDYQYYGSAPPQIAFSNGPGGGYGIPDTGEEDIFRDLNNIGSSFDAFSQFSPTAQFAPSFPTQPYQQQQQQGYGGSPAIQAPKSLSPESSHDEAILQTSNDGSQRRGRQSSGSGLEQADAMQEDTWDGSDDKDPNSLPAQDRRKAQNRAAQRAFRERKERHVKDLEAKLETLNSTLTNLKSDNERQKRELAALSTQNEILRATHATHQKQFQHHDRFQPPVEIPRAPSPVMGPQTFTASEFVRATAGPTGMPVKFDTYANKRGRMLLAGAAWDLIVRDPRISQGKIDLEQVCRKLTGKAMCDGRGPAFMEDEIRKVLDECANESDDLL